MTGYEQGTDVEYDLMHYYEYRGYYVMRSAGSHGLADIIVVKSNVVLMIQAKKHAGLREYDREEKLRLLPKPSDVRAYIAWKFKVGRRVFIRLQDIYDEEGKYFTTLTPLTKKQDKELQTRKKAEREQKKIVNKIISTQ